MNWRQVMLAVVLLVLAVTLEISVFTRFDLPGATPDLVTVVVVAFALILGSAPGAAIGFAAGLAMDLAPPADGIVGITAIVLALLGYAVGSVSLPEDRAVLPALGVVLLAAPVVIVAQAALGSLLGSPRVTWDAVPSMALSSVVYAAFMAPFVVPFVWFLARRLASTRPRF